MGFFSSVVRFVKKVVSAVLGAIAGFMNSVFGSPIVAALVLFVVSWWFAGPAAFTMLWANPVVYITSSLQGFVFTMMLGNLITTLATAISPKLGKIMGYAVGMISLFMTGMDVYSFMTSGVWNGAATFSALLAKVGVTTEALVLETMFKLASGYAFVSLATSLAAGTNSDGSFKSPYARGYVDGFFAPVEAVAGALDTGLSSAGSSLGKLLLWIGAGFLGYKAWTKPDSKVVIKRATLGVS